MVGMSGAAEERSIKVWPSARILPALACGSALADQAVADAARVVWGDGLVRMKQADRAVTVRGLAEREVTADLATWTISYSAKAGDLQTAQSDLDGDTRAIRAFFGELGFKGSFIVMDQAKMDEMAKVIGGLQMLEGSIGTLPLTADERPGAKFADMDLIGTPWQIIVGPKGLAAGKVELKNRKTGAREELPIDELAQRFG